METIVTILRAAHCRSTHHFLAIDAMEELSTSGGRALGQMLLAQFEQYLLGAKAPDTSFKDFENHVVHVQDGYWGGAAKTADKWYLKCIALLRQQQWKDAAFAVGVLSHYFSDPWMPLHTGQTPKETAVHRPLEWSVTCSYHEIAKIALGPGDWTTYELPTTSQWLSDAIHEGATLANEYYHALIDTYDMRESSKQPSLALPVESKRILAQLFRWVWSGWAGVLEKMAADVGAPTPPHSLTLPTLMATVTAPKKKIVSMIESHEQKREVERIMDEYLQTGKVVRNVPEESIRVQTTRSTSPELKPAASAVSKIREQIQAQKANTQMVLPRQSPVQPNPPLRKETNPAVGIPKQAERPLVQAPLDVVPTPSMPTKVEPFIDVVSSGVSTPKAPSSPVSSMRIRKAADFRVPVMKQTDAPEVARRSSPQILAVSSEPRSLERAAGRRLGLSDPIVDAPGIGPKTAKRFEEIGIQTVADFLEADAAEMADALSTSWITENVLRQWKIQTRLATEVEALTAVGAGLLALLGIESAQQLARQSSGNLHAELIDVSASNEGKRLLRNQEPPGKEVIARWIDNAKRASASAA